MAPPFLTSALDGGEWSASRLGRFSPVEIDCCKLVRKLHGSQSLSELCEEEKDHVITRIYKEVKNTEGSSIYF
jgi:hypothetical protein